MVIGLMMAKLIVKIISIDVHFLSEVYCFYILVMTHVPEKKTIIIRKLHFIDFAAFLGGA